MPIPFAEPLEPRMQLAAHGLSATYFNNSDFGGTTFSRVDREVDFAWPDHARPAKPIGGTTFAVRWSGLVRPRNTETVTFSVRANDGARLWVNGQLLVNAWQAGAVAERSGSIALEGGKLYDLRLEHFTGRRVASVKLAWRSATVSKRVVPSNRLFAYDTRAAVIGDYGKTNDGAHATSDTVHHWAPDYVVTVGDNNYDNGGADTIDANIGQFYHDFIGSYAGRFGAGSSTNRFFPSLGNHDWDMTGASPYLNYFALPGNERYYEFVKGSVHCFAIDSDAREPDGTSSTSTQAQWLQQRLAASTSPFNVVYFHHPPFSSGGTHGSTAYMQWPFKQWGADVVLTGHDHNYERLEVGGLTYVVDGSGSETRPMGSTVAGSVFRNASDTGALLVQANDLAMTFQYELRDGSVIDAFSISN